jgi:xylulose-5-phosphate/fructose-6-phosphate phosphoketolase
MAGATANLTPLTPDELRKMDAYWRACNYLSAGMIYLRANPLLREPLKPEHIKNRLLGHWGSDPVQSFVWVHLNRVIKKYDLNVMYISGPGHGAPATLANCYLEGHYSEIYPDKSRDESGMLKFFRQFRVESAHTALRKRLVPFTKAESWAIPSRTLTGRRSTIPTSSSQ